MFFKGEVPFVRLLIPVILGIASGRFLATQFLIDWSFELCLLILSFFLLLLIGYKRYLLFRFSWIFGVIIHLFLFGLSFNLTGDISGRFDSMSFYNYNSDLLLIKIQDEPKLSKGNFRFEAEVTGTLHNGIIKKSRGKLSIALEADSTRSFEPDYGNVLLIPGVYNAIDPPYNPGEFDYKSFMENRQIYFQSYVGKNQFHLLAVEEGNPLVTFALLFRRNLISKFNTYIPDLNSAALASTLILGYRAELNEEIIEAYSKTGTMHVLSVSGMHVGIIFLVLTVLLKPIDKTNSLKLVRIIIILTTVWFYSMISGFSSPVCRAAIMISFVVIGKAFNRNQNTYNLIAISAFFLLLYYPFYLFDVGFQLSYLAVCGLVYFQPKLYQSLFFKNKLADYVWSYSALSVAAQLATFPISLYYFHQFPLYFLLSNLLIVLPVTIIMYAGILLLVIPFSLILVPLGKFLSGLITFTNEILFWIESLPFSSLSGLWINGFQFFLICSMVITVVFWSKSNKKNILLAGIVLSLILLISISLDRILNIRTKELIFFSLRKNTAIAFSDAGKSIVLANFDSEDRIFNYSIKPALESRVGSNIKLFNIEDNLGGQSYWSDSNFMQFGRLRVLLWNRNMILPNSGKRLKVDILILSQNPVQKLKDINDFIEFKQVLIEANNYDYKIQAWLSEAAKLEVSVYVLKKSPAYIIKL
jgi:competence protein ComEC